MRHRIVISTEALRAITTLSARLFPVGISRSTDVQSMLVHSQSMQQGSAGPPLHVVVEQTTDSLARGLQRLAARKNRETSVFLGIGIGPASGRIGGFLVTDGIVQSLDEIQIVGARMPVVRLRESSSLPPLISDSSEAWSRTIGALGEPNWRRLTTLRYTVVGCGRTGSIVVDSLGRLGVRELATVDPDYLGRHNLGEMAVSHSDLHRPKTRVVADRLDQDLSCEIQSIPESIFSFRGLAAFKEADIVVCCVDNPAARMAVDFLARLYLKPVLDIGTGIIRSGRQSVRAGADIRLVLPGRCLRCFGGIGDGEEAISEIRQLADGTFENAPTNWRTQRAGSLRSLNLTAAGCALRLLEEFVSGPLQDNAWVHLEWTNGGVPVLENRQPQVPVRCAFCDVTGSGDAGLPWLPELSKK